jgi:hypothetical protein
MSILDDLTPAYEAATAFLARHPVLAPSDPLYGKGVSAQVVIAYHERLAAALARLDGAESCPNCGTACVREKVAYDIPYGTETVQLLAVEHMAWRCPECRTIVTDAEGEAARSNALVQHLQKRACELDLRARIAEEILESMQEISRSKLPCGHLSAYGFTDNGGKTGYCTLCRIAELHAALKNVVDGNDLALTRVHSIENWRDSDFRKQAQAALYPEEPQ